MNAIKKLTLGKQILIAIVIGLIIGFASDVVTQFISPLGNIFLRLLRMLIVPLVFFSITSGVCKMGDVKQLRKIGLRFMLWIVISAVIAAAVGVAAGLIVQPGLGTTEFLATDVDLEAIEYSFVDNVVSWVPENVIGAMVEVDMLQTFMVLRLPHFQLYNLFS